MYRFKSFVYGRPQLFSPAVTKLLSLFLAGVPQSLAFSFLVHNLKVAQLMEENVVEEESPNSEVRPLCATPGSELLGTLVPGKMPREADPWRKGADGDFSPFPLGNITQPSGSPTTVVEVHDTEASIRLFRQPTQ